MVNEQRESNRLLKKLVGESSDNNESVLTITSSPRGFHFPNFLKSSRYE